MFKMTKHFNYVCEANPTDIDSLTTAIIY